MFIIGLLVGIFASLIIISLDLGKIKDVLDIISLAVSKDNDLRTDILAIEKAVHEVKYEIKDLKTK